MAVVQVATIQRFMGLAADSKPTSPPVGSSFWETDTGATYVYDGSVWKLNLELVVGNVAHDAVDAGNPVKIGGPAVADISAETNVAVGDRVNQKLTRKGAQYIAHGAATGDAADANAIMSLSEIDGETPLGIMPYGVAPDTAADRLRAAGNSGPGFGAQNVAPIGGDITLRASAIAGQANGTSTAEDNLGWVKSFNAHLDVTAVPAGGTPTLNVRIQTQLASGDWQDIVAFTQVAGAITSEIVAYGPAQGNVNGTQAEGAAVTVDNFFAEQSNGLTAGTIRLMPLGDSLRVSWVFAAGGSTGDYTFAVTGTFHS